MERSGVSWGVLGLSRGHLGQGDGGAGWVLSGWARREVERGQGVGCLVRIKKSSLIQINHFD